MKWMKSVFYLVCTVTLLVLICNSLSITMAGSGEQETSNVLRNVQNGVKRSEIASPRDPSGESVPAVVSVVSGVEEESPMMGNRLRARREIVQEMCRKYNPPANLNVTLIHRDYYFHHHNTTVCLIAKAGSSTWRDHMRRVNGGPPRNLRLDDDELRKQLLALPTLHLLSKINASVKIITVRHPLTRLVSCYRQKYKNGRMLAQYNPAQQRRRFKKKAGATWPNMVHQFWVPALHSNHLLPPNLHHRLGLQEPFNPEILYDAQVYVKLRAILQPRLSFKQFLNHVVATFTSGKIDSHWAGYNSECSPCYFNYQYVTKVETMTEDLEFVFKAVGIPSNPNVVMNKLRDSVHNVEVDYNYYRNVPVSLRRRIYYIYKLDFEMYDYELPKWFLAEE